MFSFAKLQSGTEMRLNYYVSENLNVNRQITIDFKSAIEIV